MTPIRCAICDTLTGVHGFSWEKKEIPKKVFGNWNDGPDDEEEDGYSI